MDSSGHGNGFGLTNTNKPYKIGFDEADNREFARALQQQLYVQTPLQTLLQTLFSRLQAQATLFSDLQGRFNSMEAERASELKPAAVLARLEEAEARAEQEASLVRRLEEQVAGLVTQACAEASARAALEAHVKTLQHVSSTGSSSSDGNRASAATAQVLPNGDGLGAARSLVKPPHGVGTAHEASMPTPVATAAGAAGAAGGGSPTIAAPPHGHAASTPAPVAAAAGSGAAAAPAAAGVAGGGASTIAASSSELAGRVAALEARMSGVYNLPGKLASLEHIATDVIGLAIPDLEAAPNTDVAAFYGGAAGAASAAGATGAAGAGKGFKLPGAAQVDALAAQLSSLSTAFDTATADALSLHTDVSALGETLRSDLASMHDALSAVGESTAVSALQTGERLEVLEEGAANTREALAELAGALRAIREEEPEVSLADFVTLKNHTVAVTNELNNVLAEVEQIRDTDMPALQDAITDLQAQSAGEAPRDMDSAFHQRISCLELKMDDIKGEVQVAIGEVMEDLPKHTDLEDMEARSATKDEIQQLAHQQAALALSVNSMADFIASQRSEAKDASASAGGAALTRFKCLTCNSELPGGSGGGGYTGAQSLNASTARSERGSFLPRLDASAGATGSPHGPGMSQADARAARMRGTGSPVRGGGAGASSMDYAEYGGHGGDGHLGAGGGNGPSTRKADNRVAVHMPASGLKMPPGPKAPVFVA
ncbi:hypothetical protein FOA52_006051 [Chlamydomonas sp. UWO 241]|nr:hypothetical protein FOA52_006051 [Chlamydomonas sp. UWO 241]